MLRLGIGSALSYLAPLTAGVLTAAQERDDGVDVHTKLRWIGWILDQSDQHKAYVRLVHLRCAFLHSGGHV